MNQALGLVSGKCPVHVCIFVTNYNIIIQRGMKRASTTSNAWPDSKQYIYNNCHQNEQTALPAAGRIRCNHVRLVIGFGGETRSPGRVRVGATCAFGGGSGTPFVGAAGVVVLRARSGGPVVRTAGVVAVRVGLALAGVSLWFVKAWPAPLVTAGKGRLRAVSEGRLAAREGNAVSGALEVGFGLEAFSSRFGRWV